MQAILTVVEAPTGKPLDVVLTADPDTTVGAVVEAAHAVLHPKTEALASVFPLRDATTVGMAAPRAAEGTGDQGDGRLYLGNRPIDPDLRIKDSPIRDGAVVSYGAPGPGLPAEPSGAVELRVYGGPAAGAVHRLSLGERTVGRAPVDGVNVADRRLGDEHLRLVVRPDGVFVAPLPGNTVQIEGVEVDGEWARWQPGELLAAGETLFALATPARPDVVLTPAEDGGLAYYRPARAVPHREAPSLQIPQPPMKRSNKAKKEYAQAVAAFEAAVAAAARDDELYLRHQGPDPAELLLTAIGPRRRLWERRSEDPDTLHLRLGVRDLPAAIHLVGETAGVAQPVARSAPVAVALREVGVLGVAGPAESRLGLARWLLVQAALLHSPRDLTIVVLGGQQWEWVRWLPHVRPRHGQHTAFLVGNDLDTAARRTAELGALVAARRESAGQGPGERALSYDPVLVLLDGARPLRRLPGMPAVLSGGPPVGVFAICLDDDGSQLPEECNAVVAIEPGEPTRLHLATTGAQERRDVLADQVSPGYALRIARAIAPVRDVGREDAPGGLPGGVRLLDQLGLDPPEAEQIADGWRIGGGRTSAVLGLAAEGQFAVDLRVDGPHALVAGTKGAGRSQLLQTMIASLAVANRPDACSFVLIDYQGDKSSGTAFAACADLPHTAGVVTHLDRHLATRALESLAAELRRREEADPPMPLLMVVVDEFASLLRDLPDFVSGLVDIARRGSSLGIHLILATAAPAGLVSPDIAAITNLRIALRAADERESREVIDAPDASRISEDTPGRAYARRGRSSLVAFQSASVSGRAPGATGAEVIVHAVPWAVAGQPLPRTAAASAGDDGPTDLSALVSAIGAAAELLELPPPAAPWLPPLPKIVSVDDLPAPRPSPAGGPGWVPPAPYALADTPARQSQQSMVFDLQADGHLMVVGAPGTGRSTLLRTIAGSIAAATSPRDVHLHAVDCGDDTLLPLLALPHCGGVVSCAHTDRLERLLQLLEREVSRRRQLLAELGYADVAEQRARVAPDARLPYLVVLFDGWEEFQLTYADRDGGRLVAALQGLLTEGVGLGVRFLLTADRNGLTGPLSAAVPDRIVLRLADPADYGLVGVRPTDLPVNMAPGRAFATRDRCEVQVALLADDPSGTAQAAAVEQIGRTVTASLGEVPRALRPARVDALPTRVTRAEARALSAADPPRTAALVGVGGDALGPCFLDLADHGPGVLVAGPAKSGRSTALVTMLRSLLAQGWQALLVAPRRSPLRDLAGMPGVTGVLDAQVTPGDLRSAWDVIVSPRLLVVDDIELFGPGDPIDDSLTGILVAAAQGTDAIIAAGTTEDVAAVYRGFGSAIRRSHSGVLLTPTGARDGDIFGVRLPTGGRGQAIAGRGLIIRAGGAEPVQVAVEE